MDSLNLLHPQLDAYTVRFEEALLDEIRDIMDNATEDQSGAYRDALSDTVRDWFVNHFKSKDARLHKQLGV